MKIKDYNLKIIIPISVVALALAIFIPLFALAQSGDNEEEPEEDEVAQEVTPEGEQEEEPQDEAEEVSSVTDVEPSPEEEISPDEDVYWQEVEEGEMELELFEANAELDKTTTIRVLLNGAVIEMSLYDYLIGVVSAEMPTSFEPEALKAQAVAARTYTLYKKYISSNHTNADVCGDHTCCKAYSSDDTLRSHWGSDYESNHSIIETAVNESGGEIMAYNNEPILAVFHSSSSGYTESSANVWGGDMPYLQSVKSYENESAVPNYYSSVELTYSEFKSTFLASYPNASLNDDDKGSWITNISRSQSGRITTLTIGGVTIKGTTLRTLFSLRSTAITIDMGGSGIKLSTKGYGHGVGLSQYGANSMAANGSTYRDILTWYYTGSTLTTLDTLGY